MHTECSADLFGFTPVERRAVVAGFDGGQMTSDAGALLLGATDRAIGLVDRFADCFTDSLDRALAGAEPVGGAVELDLVDRPRARATGLL
jgi:hypothetical protein